MTRTMRTAAGLCLLLTMACDGNDRRALETPATVTGDDNLVRPRTVIVEGCLTASGDRFVLTELAPGARGPRVAEREGERPAAEAEPTTESYRLIGLDEQLRPLVGRRVEITGTAEPEKVVEIRESSPPTDAGNQRGAGTSGGEPQVSTLQTTRLEIGDLRVNSVNATAETCGPPTAR